MGKYIIDAGQSEIKFDVNHLMFSSVKGQFTKFQGEIHFAPSATPGVLLLESSTFLEIDASSLDSGLGQTADQKATSTMEATKFPLMRYKPAEKGLELDTRSSQKMVCTSRGLVRIRATEREEDFHIAVEEIGNKSLRLRVTATIDRFAYDVCSYWPSMTLAKDVRMNALLVAKLAVEDGEPAEQALGA